jgi:hypothetical protein
MDVIRVEDGLWHWTGAARENTHASAPAGSIYYEGPDALVLIDPVVPDTPHQERFWKALDSDVSRLDLPPVAITTGVSHDDGAVVFEARYGTVKLQAWRCGKKSRAQSPPDSPLLPRGVQLFGCGLTNERAIWIEEHRALVTGSFLHGVDGASLALADADPATATSERVSELSALTRLAPRHVLTCSGRPVVDLGEHALCNALS